MRLLQDGMAQTGMVVSTDFQSAGKGQRGKQWQSNRGENIAMSLILADLKGVDIYYLSFLIPVCVRMALQDFMPECQIAIKWPNDIFVNNQKLCGILIENVLRGGMLQGAVIGIGINVNQQNFDSLTNRPASMYIAGGRMYDRVAIITAIRATIINALRQPFTDLIAQYNNHLWQKGTVTAFLELATNESLQAEVVGVNKDFELCLSIADRVKTFRFGSLQWL